MEINWFTVIAQVINFFILVWLLKRFLYKPILKAIDERESKIVAQLKEAEVKQAEAKEEQEVFQQKNVAFDQEKKDRMEKVVSETAEERKKLLDQARIDAEALTNQQAIASKEQQHNDQKDRNQKMQETVFAILRKTLTDLASASLEEQLTAAFIKRLQALAGEALQHLKTAFTKDSSPILIRSAFIIPAQPQKELKKAIDLVLAADTSLKFEVTPSLIGGIELSTHEYKLAWSISEYLRAFEETISKTNHTQTAPPVLEKQNA